MNRPSMHAHSVAQVYQRSRACKINQRHRASAVSNAPATNRPVNKWFFADLLMF